MVNQRPELVLVFRPTLTTGLCGLFQGWFFSLFKHLSCILALPFPHCCEGNWLPRASFQTLSLGLCHPSNMSAYRQQLGKDIAVAAYVARWSHWPSDDIIWTCKTDSARCITVLWFNQLSFSRRHQLPIIQVLAGRRMGQSLVLPRGYFFSYAQISTVMAPQSVQPTLLLSFL